MKFARVTLLWASLAGGCTFHHVRDEAPVPITVGGEAATIEVERAPARRGGERLLIKIEHPSFLDIEGVGQGEAELHDSVGVPLTVCRRIGIERTRLTADRRQSRVSFFCRWPLTQTATLQAMGAMIPVLGSGGLQVMGERPWLLSGWVRAQLGARITGTAVTQGVDLGANFGGRGLLRQHLGLGGRADVMLDARTGRGQFVAGPEVGFVHATWPCGRCSVEANLSYLIGYERGFAHGPELDLRFGVRMVRTGTNWHGLDLGVGYRHLIGPESGGSLMFSLSYTVQTALRWGFLPESVRARPSELQAEPEGSPRGPEDE